MAAPPAIHKTGARPAGRSYPTLCRTYYLSALHRIWTRATLNLFAGVPLPQRLLHRCPTAAMTFGALPTGPQARHDRLLATTRQGLHQVGYWFNTHATGEGIFTYIVLEHSVGLRGTV